jgi:molecular chaperone GrpE
MHTYSDEVSGPTCTAILQVGYRIDDRVLRPARVAVAEPTAAIDVPEGQPASATAAEQAPASADGSSSDDAEAEGDRGEQSSVDDGA